MEQLLSFWIDRLNHQHAAVEFKVSQCWFMRFKERKSYHSIKKQGERASSDEQVAADFPKALAGIIEENRFLAEYIFNVDKTVLY